VIYPTLNWKDLNIIQEESKKMEDYTWEDWCWNSSVYQIADALNIDRWEFTKEIGKFWGDVYEVYTLAGLDDLVKRGKLNWDEIDDLDFKMDDLYKVIADYVGRNKEYVAKIERAMLEDEKMLIREEVEWMKNMMKHDFNIDDILQYVEDYRRFEEIEAYLAAQEAEELKKKEGTNNDPKRVQ